MARETQEEDPSDDEWESESGGVDDIEKEAAEADRGIDELEEALSRFQMFVDESCHHSERLPCFAHKVSSPLLRSATANLPQCESVHLL